MNKSVNYFALAAHILPLITTVVKLVETFPSASGAEKKTTAMVFLKSVWSGLQDPQVMKIKEIEGVPFEAVEPILGIFIDAVVSALNYLGIFGKE